MSTIGKKKQRQETSQQSQYTNNYGYIAQPDNPYYKMAEQAIGAYDGGRGEIISSYGRLENEIKNSGNEFFGAGTNDAVREKTRDNRLFRATIDKGRDLGEAANSANQYKTAGYMSLGGATAPQLVQTGGSSSGSGKSYGESWGSGLLSPVGQLGMQGASMAMA